MVSERLIAKGASRARHLQRPSLFYPSAREAFKDFLAHASMDNDAGVLLPAYIGWSPREGSGVFDPVAELDLPAQFYAVNRDLTVDLADLEHRLQSGRFRAVVVIHYYGRTDPALEHVHRLASEHGVPLVEDNAHGFFSAMVGGASGALGDVSLYSLHKMFPVTKGGMAVYQSADLVTGQRSTYPAAATDLLSYDWRAIAERRRNNFIAGTELLSAMQGRSVGFELVWPSLAPQDVPQSLPIFITTDDRDALYEKLNEEGLGVVSLYHTLIPQLRNEFPTSVWAAQHILNLPVHQDLLEDDLRYLIRRLDEVMLGLAAA